jgi:ABC-type multidrug transport system fused ATPase/permease subunit
MLKFFKKIFFLLDQYDLIRILFILFLTSLSAIFDLIGIGVVITILNIFVGNEYAKYIGNISFLDGKSKEYILITVLILLFAVHFVKFFISKYIVFAQSQFTHNLFTKISRKILKSYLNKNYLFHISNNTSILIRNVISEANLFSFGVVYSLIRIISEIFIFIFICCVLLIYETNSSLLTVIFFSIFGFILFKKNNYELKYWGKKRQFHSGEILKQLQQCFLSIREVIINNMEDVFLKRFHFHNLENAIVGIKKDTASQMPRLILELITIFTFVFLIIFLLNTGKNIDQIFVIVGTFFYASIRLLPSISKIIQSAQSVKYNYFSTEVIYNELSNYAYEKDKLKNNNKEKENSKSLEYKEIIFNKVSFIYPDSKNKTLNNINIKIKKGDKIGVIGKTGSGKSTFINLFCGLFFPTEGSINIDHNDMIQKLAAWHKSIGYVPQTVSIIDESLLFNITLEDDLDKINLKKVNELLQMVDLHDLIYNNPKNIHELAGENGVKLSGGERQRLGIVRALYRDPCIIILDEATSSLDEITENLIISNLFDNIKDKTIISISHKKSSLKFCDRLLEVKNNFIKEII